MDPPTLGAPPLNDAPEQVDGRIPVAREMNKGRPYFVMQDLPILCWFVVLNRDYTKEEYDRCHYVVQMSVPHVNIPYEPANPDSFRQVVSQMLPLLMMRHRRIPRNKWRDLENQHGQRWIEQTPGEMPPEQFAYSHIGYHLEVENSLCGMAMVQGLIKRIINIGLGMKQICVEPRGISVSAYAESLSHKLSPQENAALHPTPPLGDDVVLRRLCTLLAIKNAYIKAIGQPLGFDYSRLDFNIPAKTATGDEHPLVGWEFRIWKSSLGVMRRDQFVEEQYICAIAFFRGDRETRFLMYETTKEMEKWIQYISVEQIMKIVPKLNPDNPGASLANITMSEGGQAAAPPPDRGNRRQQS